MTRSLLSLAPMLTLSLALPLVFAACSQPGQTTAPVTPDATPTTAATAATPATAVNPQRLSGYYWQLKDATDGAGARIDALFPRPEPALQVTFQEGRVSIANGCNMVGGSYTLKGDALSVGPMVMTQRACTETALMKADDAISERLAGGSTLVLAAGETPTLTLATAAGDTLHFNGVPTPQTKYGSEGTRMFLEVAPERVACHHPMMPDYKCLHVREIQYGDNGVKTSTGEWQFLYQDIEGYTHKPGIRNVLRLHRFDRKDPVPADASSVAYVLDMVVESEMVKP